MFHNIPILQVLFILFLIGLAVWAVNAHTPLSAGWKKLITWVAAILTGIWLLNVFGVWAWLSNVKT